MPTKVKVRVRPGYRYGTHNQHPAGTVLLVDPAAARSFNDTLEVLAYVEDEGDAEQQPPELSEVLRTRPLTALTRAGYGTPEAIRAASDDALLAVSGVGVATLERLRNVYGTA